MNRIERIREAVKDAPTQIGLKKAKQNKRGDSVNAKILIYKDASNKGDLPQDEADVIYRTINANTYLYKDSHDDVHLPGIFSKTIKETPKIYLLHDHIFETTAQIGVIIKSYEKEVAWKEVGLDIEGKTTALLHDVKIERVKNPAIFEMYKNGEIKQHSVGMQYVNIKLAADDPEDKEAYDLYTSVLPRLGNKDEVQEQGYFYVVSEAKLRETSAVLMGSNDLTGVYDENDKTELSKEEELEIVLQKFDNIDNIDKICKQYKNTLLKDGPLKDTQKTRKPFNYAKII